MYLKHYNLDQLPFRNSPDPRFFLETAKHNEALANLIYAVEQRRGFVLLTGEIGSGKTLVTHLLLQQVEDHALVALIRNTHLNSTQLVRLVCDEFSVPVGNATDKAAMLLALNQFLIQQLAEDRLVVIIIDEAQNLSDRVLEELRMLSNLETSSDKLLQIVLVGQPELRDKISQPHLEQLRQRIALNYHLAPLSRDEVAQYVSHRLQVAGARHNVVFTPEAIERIYKFSRGTPRLINGACDNALLYGFTAGVTSIDGDLVERVLKQSMQLSPRQRVGPVRTPTYSAPAPREVSGPQVPNFGAADRDGNAPRPTTASMLRGVPGGGKSEASVRADAPDGALDAEESDGSDLGRLKAGTFMATGEVRDASAATRGALSDIPRQVPPATQGVDDRAAAVSAASVPAIAAASREMEMSAVDVRAQPSAPASTIGPAPVLPDLLPPAQSNSATAPRPAATTAQSLPGIVPAAAGALSESIVLCVPAEALFGLPQM